MRGGTPLTTVLRNPTLVGALTVLIVVVAVFLAYNANSGLPFVPTYRLTAEVPNANTLVPGNEVRIGGVRVGLVETITPVQDEDGSVHADLGLKLDQQVEELPVDSTMIVRARSALGLKYLEIVRGNSAQGFEEGDAIPMSAARPEPVEIDQVLNTFDDPTRAAAKDNLLEFGNALAGRGYDLNEAIGALHPLLPRLERVTAGLAKPSTQFGRFWRALSRSAAEVAPIAEVQAQMFVNLDVTFAAFAEVARPYIQETISRTPPALDALIEDTPRIRPFLANTAGFFDDLRPGVRVLAESADEIESALLAGVPALRLSPQLNRQLPPTAAALLRLNDDRPSRFGISRLTELGEELSPALRFIGPAQSVCQYGSLVFRNLGSLLSGGDGVGNWQRFIIFDLPKGPNNEGSPASGPANGPDLKNYLHTNPYPNSASPRQKPRECAAGNEPYAAGQQVIGNPPGNLGTRTGDVRP